MHLTRLDLEGLSIQASSLAVLGAFPDLVALSVSGTGLNDEVLALVVTRCRKLSDLSLADTLVTPRSISRLSELGDLVRLDLSGTDASDDSLGTLHSLRQLQTLKLAGAPVEGKFLPAFLGTQSRLRILDLSGTVVTTAALIPLVRAPRLSELALAGTRLDQSAVPVLKGLTRLRFLDVRGAGIPDAATALARPGLTVRADPLPQP